MQSVRRMAKAKIITREEVASELGKWGPGLSLCCDECGGKGMEAVAEFAFKGQYHHHVCLVCMDVARARLLTILQAINSVTPDVQKPQEMTRIPGLDCWEITVPAGSTISGGEKS